MAIFNDMDNNKGRQNSAISEQRNTDTVSYSGSDANDSNRVGAQLSRFLPGANQSRSSEEPSRMAGSLERQVVDAGSRVHPMAASVLGAALGRANSASVASKKPEEYLNSAVMDFHSIQALLNAGKVGEAEQVAKCALKNLAKCQFSDPKVQSLLDAFVLLFERKNMTAQAAAFKSFRIVCEKSATAMQPANFWKSEL